MNVKTLKRFSKRSVSMLLSVLMVLSLFTVCMVGSSITAGAIVNNAPPTTITIHLNGTAAQSWEHVYFVIGRDNGGNYDGSDYSADTSFYEMRPVSGKEDTYTLNFSGWNYWDQCFFAGTTVSGTNLRIYSDVYNPMNAALKSKQKWGSDSVFYKDGNLLNPLELEIEAEQKESIDYTTSESITAHKTASTKKWGKTGTDYENVYLVIGNNINVQPGATTSVYTMVNNGDGTFSTPTGFSFTGAAYYFFTTIDPSSYAGSGKKIDDAYNYVTHEDGDGDKVTNKFTTKLTDLELVVSNKTFIDATLYNYRSGNTTDGTGGQIGGTANDTDAQKYALDSSHDYSTGNETNYKPFMQYNKAVDAWFNGASGSTNTTYTPLYAGNFKDTKYDNSVQGAVEHMGLRNFVYIANVAEHGNAHSVAVGLVDDTLSGGTITQAGKEIPQFSDAFIAANPTLQSKYSDLKFQVNANKHMNTGNTWYSYNSSSDGNRYLDVENKKLVEGPNINNEFFPFDESNDGNLVKCFGLKFEVEFVMPDGGIANGEKLQFNFTGDDDLWVYIDDELVLDMGGAHGAVKGSIDLSHNTSDHPNTTHPNITGTVQSDSYNNTTIAKMNGAHQYDTNWDASNWTDSNWQTNRVRTITGDAATKIQDTTKPHKMTIFYMERGLYNSNLSFNFMLPLANTLSLSQEVDNKNVNQGLKRATMDVATKDVFKTAIQAQNMAEAADNIQKYPIDEDFTRQSPSRSTTYTLQEAGLETKTTSKNIASGNGPGGPGYTGTTAAYAWTDESKLIDEAGNYTDTNAAANKGVGLPLTDAGYIPLLYGQTATFFDQFFTTGVNIDNNPNIKFFEDEYVHKFDTSYAISDPNNPNDPGDPYRIAKMHDVIRFDGQNNKPKRAVSTYYETTFTVKDGYGASLIKPGTAGQEFPYYNKDGSTNKVDAYIDYKHVILVGGISVKKEIDDSITDDTTPNKNKEYKFKVEYVELFGDLDNTYMVKDAVSGKDKVNENAVWTTMQRVKYTLTKKNGTTEPDQTIPYEGTNAGIFKLKEGETATITGIPVGTVVRVKELIEDDAEYEVKDITDGSGNKPSSTTKVVEKPMFITEGIKDNTTYSYIIKNGLAMQTASLVVNNKVTTTGVNSGIATELEKIFNNDVFGYKVQTNSKKVSTNPAKLPITSDFTRTKGDGTTSDTLQAVTSTTGTKGNTGSTDKTLTGMDAYYKWTDTSGKATGSGVGVPVDNTYNVHLQYDQTATFDSQIVLDKDGTEADPHPVYVNVEQAPKTYTNGANTGTGGTRLANIDNDRTVAELYTTTYNITGANSTNGTAAYPKNASQLSENENVVIEYTFTNAVNLGKIQISKTVADGSDANINPNGSYEFTLTYTKLFGKTVSETPAAGWEGTSSTGATIITDGTGTFSIKKGETVTFTGVPVQTDYKVTEVIPDGAKYAVKGATLTDKNATDISSSHLTRSSNVCTVTGSLVNVNDISTLTVDNTYSTVPILYRYHNRVNQNGYVTHLQNDDSSKGELEWTYFVKYVDGAISTFIDGSGNITSDAKTAAIDAFGTVAIDNVLATYSLTTSSTYGFHTLTDAEKSKDPYYSTEDTAANVGYKDSMKALADNGNFYNGDKVILATIKNTARTYPVKVAYFKANEYNSTTKVNPMAEASTGVPDEATRYSADVPYNTVVPLNTTITRLMLDDPEPTSNTSNGKYLFAYWEREVSYQSGNRVIPQWVPVSTNYQYSYKVVNPTNIRAVYRSTDGHNKKAYADYDTKKLVIGADNSFNALEGGSTTVPTYEKVPIPTYVIYWKKIDGVKLYLSTSGSYSISESVATTALSQANGQTSPQALIEAGLSYTTKYEKYKAEYLIPTGQEICLPANGYDAAATDKVINPYVKQVGSTAQNRAVFDIVFGSAGSDDGDIATNTKPGIEYVGYILFYGQRAKETDQPNYIDLTDEKVKEANLKAIANAASPGTANLTDATQYPGSGKCRVAKYIADKDGTLGDNEIRLTTKNRVDLIIDVINDGKSRNKFYTCYTYMIRNGKTYISDTPITFSPSEITLGSGGVTPTEETAYNLEIDNYYQDNNNANPDDTIGTNKYTKANTYGYALSNAYTFANGKTLTLTVRPLQQGIYRGKLVKLHHGKGQITVPEEVQNGGQMTYTFNKDHIPEADGNTLKLKAYFDPVLVGAKFTLTPKHGIEFKVYFNDGATPVYTVNETTNAQEVIAPYGTKIRIDAQTVLTNGLEGYEITDSTNGSFTLADDASRSKSQMATKEVTVTTGMDNDALAAAFANLPTANALYYTVTAQQARGTYGATLNYTGGASASTTTEATQTATVGTSVPASTTLYVWQGNPVITLSETSGTYVLTAGTNTSISGNTITVTDDSAVFTIGGFATLTLSPVANSTTIATVNGNNTTISADDTPVTVPYNYDETTGTDVTVTVTSDTANDYYIGARNGYSNTSTSVASKTAILHSSITDLNSGLKPLPTTVKGYALTVTAGTGGQVTIQGAATINGDINGETVLAGESKEYVLVQGSLLTMYATPASGYNFGNWNNDTSLTSTSVQVDQVDSSLSYKANFNEIMYTLTTQAGTGGRVSNVDVGGANADSVVDNGDGTYTVGATKASGVTFTLTATPDDGYGFTNWTNGAGGTVLSTDNPYSFSISNTMTATANFAAGKTVRLNVNGSTSWWNNDGDNKQPIKTFVYYWKSSNKNDYGWVQATADSNNAYVYSAFIPYGYDSVTFVRSSSEETTGSWDHKYNQTQDIDISSTVDWHTTAQLDEDNKVTVASGLT